MLDDRNLENCCAEQWKWLWRNTTKRAKTPTEVWVQESLANTCTLSVYATYCHLEYAYRFENPHYQVDRFKLYQKKLDWWADKKGIPVEVNVDVSKEGVWKRFRHFPLAEAYQQHYLHSAESWNAVWTKREVPEFYMRYRHQLTTEINKELYETFAVN